MTKRSESKATLMKNRILAKFEHEISELKKRLKELEPHIKHNASLAIAYNRILVEKAILLDKYKRILNRPNFVQKVKNVLTFAPRQRLICDFFQENA